MTNDSAIGIGNISQVSGMLAIGGDVVVGNKTTIIQQIVRQRELIVHPYKFLTAYDISDKDIFFGRDTLTKQLAGKVSRHKILLLNGVPGSGKSSLINAGLIPYLAENGYTYLSFRDYSEPLQQLQKGLIDSGILSVANPHPEFLAHTLIALRNSKLQMVFVFDQFERFFVHVLPAARMQFIEMIKICTETLLPTEMNVIFAIREKFFGQFQREFEELIYAFMNEGVLVVNIAPLSKSEARQAIVNPLTETKIGYDDEFVDDILLVGLEAEIIEKGISPSHLQIVCNQLYQAACQQLEHKHFVVIDHKLYDQLGGTETILRTYLDDRINIVANHEIAHIQLLHSLLKQMIETAGTRKFVTAQQLYHNLPDVAPSQIDQFLMRLQDERVIETRSQEASSSYSLSHEFMVAKVQHWLDNREMARKQAEETLEHTLNEWKNSEALLTEKQIKRIRDTQIKLNAEQEEFLRASEAECDRQRCEKEERIRKEEMQRRKEEEQIRKEEMQRRKEEEQIQQIQRITLEREVHQKTLNYQRKIIQLGFVTIVIAIFGIVSYFNFRLVDKLRKEAQTTLSDTQKKQSSMLANLSRQTLQKGDVITAMSLALEALPKNMDAPERQYDPEAEKSLRNAFYHPRTEHTLKIDKIIHSVKFSADGQKVVTVFLDKTAKIWSITGELIATPKHEVGVSYAEFSPDGQNMVTVSEDKTATIRNVTTGEPVAPPLEHEGGVNYAKFSPDGQKVMTISSHKTAKIWNAKGEFIATLKHKEHEEQVNSAKFSLDGQRVVTVSPDKTATVWNVTTGEPVATLPKHEGGVNSAKFSPDGQKIVTVSEDSKVVKIWNVTGEPVATLPEHGGAVNSAEFSPDGQKVVTISWDKTATIWNVTTREPVATLKHKKRITSAEFSPDSQKVVTASEDDTAKIWNVKGDEPIATLQKHEDGVSYAEFSPKDGQRVVTASLDKTVIIWNVVNLMNEPLNSTQELIDAARKLISENVTIEESKERYLTD